MKMLLLFVPSLSQKKKCNVEECKATHTNVNESNYLSFENVAKNKHIHQKGNGHIDSRNSLAMSQLWLLHVIDAILVKFYERTINMILFFSSSLDFKMKRC